MKLRISIATLALGMVAMASAQLQISIGLRETAAGGGTQGTIGANGGSLGGIEWVNLDVFELPVDGLWHTVSFTLATATYTGFAGATANSILDGDFGVLENIRIRNLGGYDTPLSIWIDDVANTITPVGAGPQTTVFGSFEGYSAGTEVMFQEPRFSGSTTGFLAETPNFSGIDNTVAFNGSGSVRTDFAYLNNTQSNWLRLTTSNTGQLGNPVVRFDQDSVISFQMRAVPEPATMAALGLGFAAIAARRRRRK